MAIFVEDWQATYGAPYRVQADDDGDTWARPVHWNEAAPYQQDNATGNVAYGVAGSQACGAYWPTTPAPPSPRGKSTPSHLGLQHLRIPKSYPMSPLGGLASRAPLPRPSLTRPSRRFRSGCVSGVEPGSGRPMVQGVGDLLGAASDRALAP